MKKIGIVILGIIGVLVVFDLKHVDTLDVKLKDDKGRQVVIYADDKVIHTYEKCIKVDGDQVVFDNGYTKIIINHAKIKYKE